MTLLAKKKEEDEIKNELIGGSLYSQFAVWFKDSEENSKNQNMGKDEYLEKVKKIFEFSTIDEFWEIYQYLVKPEVSRHGIEIMIFKSSVKPMWEDESNKNGGKVTIKVKKEYSNLVWDEIVYRFIGNNFPLTNNSDLNGIIFSVKRDSIFIQVWFMNFSTNSMNEITASIKQILSINDNVELDIRPFNKSKDIVSNNNNYNHNFYNYGNVNSNNKSKKY